MKNIPLAQNPILDFWWFYAALCQIGGLYTLEWRNVKFYKKNVFRCISSLKRFLLENLPFFSAMFYSKRRLQDIYPRGCTEKVNLKLNRVGRYWDGFKLTGFEGIVPINHDYQH